MATFSTKKANPRVYRGGDLPEGDYTLEINQIGSWNVDEGKFEDCVVSTSQNNNPQFTVNWKIVHGQSHVGAFIRDRWTLTPNTFDDLLGRLNLLNGDIPEIDEDDPKKVLSIIMGQLKVGTRVVAKCGMRDNQRTMFYYIRLAK